MVDCVALLRGINVGRAKRVSMSELRGVFEAAGFTDVRTLLNSGNVVFRAVRAPGIRQVQALSLAVAERCDVSAALIVVSAKEFLAIVEGNPMAGEIRDHSRHLVAFVPTAAALRPADAVLAMRWGKERVVAGKRAVYLDCPDGILESPLLKAFARHMKESVTTRNWATVEKLARVLAERPAA